jgi:hypothetical protein
VFVETYAGPRRSAAAIFGADGTVIAIFKAVVVVVGP